MEMKSDKTQPKPEREHNTQTAIVPTIPKIKIVVEVRSYVIS